MKNVFFNKLTGHEIVDFSGLKSVERIKAEFGDGNYEVADVIDGEGYRVKDGKIFKYDLLEEYNNSIAEKKAKKDASISRLKVKLDLSDKDIEDLQSIL